ncbi:MAG: DNA primase [Dehalococcoidia bacterium]|nr:DNA primase [Dehalococcoidia bacterium]
MPPIDDIKQRLDIVSVVSGYVALGKAGRNFKANCPFHQEKTPSFYVFPDRQSWRCFGACATGGDIFTFVMRREQIEFGPALRLLAGKAGVELPEYDRVQEEVTADARYKEANEAAARYYHNLLINGADGAQAREYVAERGIWPETLRAFQLGYSPQRREALKQYLVGQGFTEEELVAAGLLMEGERGTYDRFHHRLMFPISDIAGHVVGFGARTLDGAPPKYLNSPQTSLFDKSGLLYALDRSKEAIRQARKAVIVEGYMDALTAHQHGFANVVASMGTALTEKQVGLLSRFTSEVVLALDADAAGEAATMRGLEVAPEAMGQEATAVPDWEWQWQRKNVNGRQVVTRALVGVPRIIGKQKGEIKVLRLPGAKDPDALIRDHPEEWQALVDGSVPMLDFVFQSVQDKVDLTSPKGKAQAVEALSPFIQDVANPVEQAHYLQRLANLVSVDERTLRDAFPRRAAAKGRSKAGTVAQAEPGVSFAVDVVEDYCLALLFNNDFLAPAADLLKAEYLSSTDGRELLAAWTRNPGSGLDHVDEWLLPRLEAVRSQTPPVMAETLIRAAFAQCVHRLEQQHVRRLKAMHRARLDEMEEDGRLLPMIGQDVASTASDAGAASDADDLRSFESQELQLNNQLLALMKRRPEPSVTE